MSNYISKVTLPSSGTYLIKDQEARDMIASIGNFIVAWDGTSAPVVANIPAGVVVTYNGTTYTGTKTAASAEKKSFYLVKSATQTGKDVYDEYVVVNTGTEASPTYAWEKIGDTQFDFGTDVVLGEATTFTNSSSTVSFSGGTTDVVLGEATTFTASGTAVGKTTKYLSASASGTAVGANGTANAVTGYPNATTVTFLTQVNPTFMELDRESVGVVTGNTPVSIPNVTSAGSASSWSFTMGTGDNSETLIISGANGTAPTLGQNLSASNVTSTSKWVANGHVSEDGGGDSVVVAVPTSDADGIGVLGTPSTASVLTGVKVTAQPSVTLTANSTTATGRITYVESLGTVTQPTITVGTNDKVTAIKTLGTATAAAQTITVGTNDKVTVLTPGT